MASVISVIALVLGGLVALSVIYMFIKVVGLVNALREESDFRLAGSLIDRIVVASEQLATSGKMPYAGIEKKNMAMDYLVNELGVKYSPDFIDLLVEAAVKDNKAWFNAEKPDKEKINELTGSMKD